MGLPEAIETLYPHTRVQICMVHMVRNSLKYVSYKHRKEVADDLKLIYSAATESEAQAYLDLFLQKKSVSSWNISGSRLVRLQPDDFGDMEAVAAVIRITGGNFRLIHRLCTQIERILHINEIRMVTKEVVDAAREQLVIGQV